MKQLVIFGTGSIGKIAHYYFTQDSDYEVVGFVVDAGRKEADTFLGLPVQTSEQFFAQHGPDACAVFVGTSYKQMNHPRAQKYQEMKDRGYTLASYVSSRCTLLTEEPIGDNCFILEHNVIQPFVRIGSNVFLWSGNHIGHESVIEDHCFLSSHIVIGGQVRVSPYCFIGMNATIRDGITLAPATLVGAGAVIMQDTVEKGVYVPPRAVLLEKKSDELSSI